MSDAHFSPEDFINYYASTKGITIPEIGVAPLVVLSWSARVVQLMAEASGAKPQENWVKGGDDLHTGEIGGQPVSFSRMPVGAAATVMMMEELIACGARTFLALGWAGSLQPDLPVGSMIIPVECISEEGTSAHYPVPDGVCSPDSFLKEELKVAAKSIGMEVREGRHWTTDAPYRELKTKVSQYREQGVLSVEMETSAMYTLGRFRNVGVCNLLVISDELWHEWRPAFGTPELRDANQMAERLMLKCVEQLVGKL